MNNPPISPLQNSTSTDIAAIEAIPDVSATLSHQRAPTPLGVLGKLPLEVRNQIYRDIFVQAKVYLNAQRPSLQSDVPEQALDVLVVSKALRIEGWYCSKRKTNKGADFVMNI